MQSELDILEVKLQFHRRETLKGAMDKVSLMDRGQTHYPLTLPLLPVLPSALLLPLPLLAPQRAPTLSNYELDSLLDRSQLCALCALPFCAGCATQHLLL